MSVRKRTWTNGAGARREAWIVDYRDQTGIRRQKTFQTKKAADEFAAVSYVEVRDGIHVPDRATVTINEACDLYLESCAHHGLDRSTIESYRRQIRLHIRPFIGSLLLSKVSVPVVRAFQDRLRKEGRSAAMIKRVTINLGAALSDAQERGLCARNSVAEMSRNRKGKPKQAEKRQKRKIEYGVDIPTREEVRLMIEKAGSARPFLITAIFTGMRASELRGLRWKDVDLKNKRVHVRQRADKWQAIGMPKSDAGQRMIPIPPMVVSALKEWKLACPIGKMDLVFPNGKGRVENYGNLVKRKYHPAQMAAGINSLRPEADEDGNPVLDEAGEPVMVLVPKYSGLHALRHFFASWCINRKVDGGLELLPKMVQERMGHSSIQVTMDTYGHLFPSTNDDESLAAAEKALLTPVDATNMRHARDFGPKKGAT